MNKIEGIKLDIFWENFVKNSKKNQKKKLYQKKLYF